jgi:hypothetical protein
MKSTPEPFDRAPVLGEVIRSPKPAPAPVPLGNGVVRNPDGTLSTNIAPPAPVWHPLPVITDGQAEDWEGLA